MLITLAGNEYICVASLRFRREPFLPTVPNASLPRDHIDDDSRLIGSHLLTVFCRYVNGELVESPAVPDNLLIRTLGGWLEYVTVSEGVGGVQHVQRPKPG